MARDSLNAVREYILGALGRGDLVPGQRLPPERELAERLRTNRATVRQALMILESEGQVMRHVGRGTYIAETAAVVVPASDQAVAVDRRTFRSPTEVDVSPAALMEARQAIEPHIAQLVVINATEGDLRDIRRIVERQRQLGDQEAFEETDIQFHEALARATHNELLIAISQLIISARQNPEWRKLKQAVRARNRGRRQGAVAEHLEIAAALDGRNAEEAAQATRRHLDAVRFNLLGY